MSKRLLVLTAGYGEGHNAAARAIAMAWRARFGDPSARVVDLLEHAAPRRTRWTRHGYIELINRFPMLWGGLYHVLDRSSAVPRMIRTLRPEAAALRMMLDAFQPTAMCSTYPAYAYLPTSRRTSRGVVPLFNVVTDSISINSLWFREPVDGWFMADDDSARVMMDAGVDNARVHVCGFPVPPVFEQRRAFPELAAPSPGTVPRVLMLINSGTRNALPMARAVLEETAWEVTIAVGRDEALHRAITQCAADRQAPTTVLGWTDQVPQLLMTHHVVVSKAGGATTQEAIAAGCPLVVTQIVPGQEWGNHELLRRHGIGGAADTPQQLLAVLRAAFADGGAQWLRWRIAIASIRKPAAAAAIVRHIDTVTEVVNDALATAAGSRARQVLHSPGTQ